MDHNTSLHDVTGQESDGVKLLTFTLGSEEFGIDLLRIQEIKGYLAITPIPNTRPYIKGVINLRGNVIPVMDLRLRFGMEPVEYTRFTVIIVVTIRTKVVGLIVDAVSDVLNAPRSDIQETPELAAGMDAACLTGLIKVGERLVMLLDLNRLVVNGELAAPEGAEARSPC